MTVNPSGEADPLPIMVGSTYVTLTFCSSQPYFRTKKRTQVGWSHWMSLSLFPMWTYWIYISVSWFFFNYYIACFNWLMKDEWLNLACWGAVWDPKSGNITAKAMKEKLHISQCWIVRDKLSFCVLQIAKNMVDVWITSLHVLRIQGLSSSLYLLCSPFYPSVLLIKYEACLMVISEHI